ncbi:MAG: hypothetical protein ABIQ31_02930 [Ferruginibacter sp.]
MEKMRFVKATAFPNKNYSDAASFNPIEILVPIEAISCLQKDPNSANNYLVKFKPEYPFSVGFPISYVEATLDKSKIDII